MVKKAKSAKAEKGPTGKKRKTPDEIRKPSAPRPSGEKLASAPRKPTRDKESNPTKPVGDKEPRPTAPIGDKERSDVPAKPIGDRPPAEAPQDQPRDEKQPRFRSGRPSNPFLVLHPPPRLGRRR
jgi:hypothetical protein